MNTELNKCLERRSLVRLEPDIEIIKAGIMTAEYDLEKAKKSLEQGDPKWAIIKAYYSMFHSAKALVCNKGYRERSHYCLLVALRALYCDSGELDPDLSEKFENTMLMREEADYEMKFSEASAHTAIQDASEFLAAAKKLLRI